MSESKIRRALAGIILGIIFGVVYYGLPTKLLITGTIPVDGLMLPKGVNSAILWLSFKWGGIIGGTIGLLGGLSIPNTLPRGHMSKSISCFSFFVCTIVAFIMHGSQLFDMVAWKIVVTFLWVLVILFFTVHFGATFSFIEKIRE